MTKQQAVTAVTPLFPPAAMAATAPFELDNKIHRHVEYLTYLMAKGGPEVQDFSHLDAWITEIAEHARGGLLSAQDLEQLRALLGAAFSTETMQGFAYCKPHGYAGDYEIIDRVYQKYISSQAPLARWDIYWQNHQAAHAVRNRVPYFGRQIEALMAKNPGRTLHVLNIASGPGRDMLAFFDNNPDARVHIHCIEQDRNAVDHAKKLCLPYLNNITFHVKNALRFQSKRRYDLVWSAGLFDYFDDKVFVFMLNKLGALVSADGEIVIGNFSTTNPSRPYMELFEWHLEHRSPNSLKYLAVASGFAPPRVRIGSDATGVNLFLHVGPVGQG